MFEQRLQLPFNYRSGQEIRKGDRVLYHDEPCEIELVADPLVSDAETAWHVKEFGGGVLVIEPKHLGAFSSQTWRTTRI
jgi:hypothetical protein